MRLGRDFYSSSDVLALSQSLLGKKLCTHIDGAFTAGMIVETEAYRAPDDKACHAYQNKRTARTETIFMHGGTSYVYLCYGIHHLFNVVTAPKDTAHAILIRAIEPIDGIEIMLARREMQKPEYRLTAGPGSMSKALGIDLSLNAVNMTRESSTLWIEDYRSINASDCFASPRVGVDYAAECAEWPWRFRIKENPWCSPAK